MKKELITNIDEELIIISDFLERMGVPYTINRNPTPEEIERVMGNIKRSEEIVKQFKKYEKRI